MEYCLYAIFYIFQSFMNMLLNFTVDNGVSIGGIILVCMVLSYVLDIFSVKGSKSGSKGSKEKSGNSAAKGEEK